MMFESRICTKINDLNIRNRYYTPDIARAERYLSNEKILYAFSPKKEKIVVVHEDNIYQYVYLSGGSLQVDCSCKKGPTCEHAISGLIYLKRVIKDLDEKCASDDNSSTLMKLKPIDIIQYLQRLVGEDYFLVGELSLDFQVICDAVTKFLCKNKESNLADIFDLLKVLISLLKNEQNIIFDRNIIEILYKISKINKEILKDYFINLSHNTNLNLLFKLFDNYLDEKNENKLFPVIELIESISYEYNINIDINTLKYVKAKYLFNIADAKSFYQFALNNIDVENIKLLLFRYLDKLEKYNEIKSLWSEDDNDEICEIYYNAKSKTVIDKKQAIEIFTRYPSLENYLLYFNKGLIEYEDVKQTVEYYCGLKEKCLIYNYVKDYQSLFNACTNSNFDFTMNYYKELYENYFEEFIKYFQDEIVNIIKNKRVFKEIIPYLQKLNQLEFGKFYTYNLVDYLIEKEYLQYYEKYQGEEFLKRMTL